jgi:hypothetical protein
VGSNGIIRGNTIKDFTGVGIFGGSNDYVAPSYYDISYNTIDSSKGRDGISLHDGFGKGIGNVIRKNSIFGGIENGIDILGMYPSTIIEDNVIRDVGLAGIIVSMGDDNISGAHDSVIRRNSISRSRTAGIYSRADRIMISENVLYKMYESRTSSGLIISGSATVTDNQIIVPSSVDRPAILIIQAPGRPKPTGIIQNNRVTSSNRTAYVFTIESDLVLGWNIDYNVYYVPYSNGIYFDSLTFEAWRAKNWGGIQSLKDRNSAFSAGAAL